ncbi:hypothetical protein Ae201684P_019853 [Aphanomyces euteiches]|uniref:Uncharacterized protein n=1 Tax=Aphanomyces euteiches TaxID=100861 RepID=A0A6G0XEG2_9STRA|nr:hypothetical protein Ae201684_005555 [Aphanomyces euteiches]KAH9078779.1 hypothetical protein Ae201684P_019853 [Aphanomyces euteiches]
MRDDYTDKEPIHMIWRDLERKYGVSNVANVKSNVNKLLKIAQSEFNSVESYLAEMKTLKNVINSNTRKYLKRDVVTDDFIALLAFGVLPSEFYGAQISLDEESFSLSDIESKLIGIFENKSKREIMGNKSGQSGGPKSDVNHVTNKRKAASVESNNGECFYCDGTQNHLTNGKSHFKKQCPLRKEHFANNDFRKHMNDKKAKKARKDVKVDMIQSIDRDAGYRESNGEVQLSVESELDLFNLDPMEDVDSSGYMDMGDASAVDVNQVDSGVISKRLKNLSIKAKHVTSNVDSEVQRNYPFLLVVLTVAEVAGAEGIFLPIEFVLILSTVRTRVCGVWLSAAVDLEAKL